MFKERTLDNGLTIIAEPDASAHSSAVGFFVKTGARDEPTPLMGVSHFLEHMMFKGTPNRSAAELNQAFDDIGARNNAYTSHEVTCFYAHVLPEFAGTATELLGDMLRPALRQDDFDTEKGVILEEIAMYKDNPFWVLYEDLAEKHFVGHTLGHRVLGTNDSIRELQRDQMQGYFDERYSADNTVVSLAGDIDFDKACEQIERICGSWKRTGVTRDNTPPAAKDQRVELTDDRFGRAYMLMLSPAPSAQDDRRYAATLLTQILGAADNSRLHWALIENGLAEEAQAAFEAHDGVGEYYVYASGDPDRIEEIERVVDTEISGLLDSLTQDDLDRLSGKFATSFTIGAERPADRMQRIGRRWTLLGEYRTLDEELERIRAVSLKDLREVYEAYPFSPRTVGVLRPPSSA
ncbi:MAG: M16 family metallopeptidase [Phycisphaerales bacterium JB058]